MAVLNISSRFPMEIDELLTMAGVITEFESEIVANWHDTRTHQQYSRYYNEYILPYFCDHPLDYYDDISYYEDVIRQIQDTRAMRRKKLFSQSTVDQLRRLMRYVVECASRHKICPDLFWGTDYSLTEKKCIKILSTIILQRIKKSFSASEEYVIRDRLFTDPLQPGQFMALLLMWILGLRNTEACGCVFGDIFPITGYDGWHILAVHCTMERATHFIQGKGKTKNFYRFVPIPPELYDFLMLRKAYLEEEIRMGRIVLPTTGVIKSVDDMPIACDRQKWLVHCTSNSASNAGRQLLKDLGYSEDCMYTIGKIAATNLWDNEKDATAYTFRRHFCTMLKILGFTPIQATYLMGHKPYGHSFKRKFFTNPDMHAELFKKMLLRPAINPGVSALRTVPYKMGTSIATSSEMRISIPCKGQHIKIRCIPNEFNKPVTFKAKINGNTDKDMTITGVWEQHKSAVDYPDEVNVLHYLYTDYARAERRHQAKKEQQKCSTQCDAADAE